MMRFANFCLAIMQRLSPSADESARQDANHDAGHNAGHGASDNARLEQDVDQKIRDVIAAIGISKVAVMLVNYVKNPRPSRPPPSPRDNNDARDNARDNDRASPPAAVTNYNALYTDYLKSAATSGNSAATTLAARIGQKAREMIRRDRLYRFGPQPVTTPTRPRETTPLRAPQVSAPIAQPRPQSRRDLLSSALPTAIGQPGISLRRLPP